jgi:hypothetical protein
MLVERGEQADDFVFARPQYAVQAQGGILAAAPAENDFFFGVHSFSGVAALLRSAD